MVNINYRFQFLFDIVHDTLYSLKLSIEFDRIRQLRHVTDTVCAAVQ